MVTVITAPTLWSQTNDGQEGLNPVEVREMKASLVRLTKGEVEGTLKGLLAPARRGQGVSQAQAPQISLCNRHVWALSAKTGTVVHDGCWFCLVKALTSKRLVSCPGSKRPRIQLLVFVCSVFQ